MDIKNMIKELEEEKNRLDMKIIKINSIVEDLKELESPGQVLYTDREEDKPKIRKILGQKRKYTKKRRSKKRLSKKRRFKNRRSKNRRSKNRR